VQRLLEEVTAGPDGQRRHSLAGELSKVAAKAEDPILLLLGVNSKDFVGWLDAEEPLVRAYTACILANIAFLEAGQKNVLLAGGVPPLCALLKSKEDKKVTLHATAAVQNLTYKNTACCQAVLKHGGEKNLKKLLQHKSEEVQQFAAGALANLQLYRRATDEAQHGPSTPLAPPLANNKKSSASLNRKVKAILKSSKRDPVGSSERQEAAALSIQALYYGHKARKEAAAAKRAQTTKKNQYNTFSVTAVRDELARNEMLPPLMPSQLRSLPGAASSPLSASPSRSRQVRLAPINTATPGALRLPPLGLPPNSGSVR